MGLLKKNTHLALLLLIVFLIALTNYIPGTYLSGWDNLQTELNPSLGVKRAVFSVWEEYQSFGLLAGMAHAADFVRAILIWFLSFVLPQSFIRYFFHTLMIFVAGVGMFQLLNFAGFSKEKRSLAVLGSLFYILNFAVIQLMFLPFEPFSVFFGLLPWGIWIFLYVLEKREVSKKDWLKFFVVNLLATPQAYIQQLFVVYLLLLLCLLIGLLIKERTLATIKRGTVAFFLIFLINSFWLLPQMYFLKASSSVVGQAKINQLATEDVFFANKDKGNIKDFLTFTGFLYDRLDKNHEPLFKTWQSHRETKTIEIIIYGLSAIYILGILKRSRYQISFILIYALSLTFLLSNTFPSLQINELIRGNSLVSQVFRSPFTKFGIPYALVASFFFAQGLDLFLTKKRLDSNRFVFIFLAVLIIVAALPAFRGNYFSKEMKVAIPKPYFELMDYFKNTDKNKRIALLPEYTFWGWFYNQWPAFAKASAGEGYNGSGFLWYGIEQPIVSRTFDVWSNKSESYFWEIKNALETEDREVFEKVLEKYNIDYLIYDKSLSPVVSSVKALQYDRIDRILLQSKKITLEKKFDFVSIYKINPQKKISDFVEVLDSPPNVGPKVKITNSDTIFQTYGDYITKDPSDIYHPFLDLTSQTRLDDKSWKLEELFTSWRLTRELPFDPKDYKISSSSGRIELNFYINDKPVVFLLPYSIFLEKNKISVVFPKIPIESFEVSSVDVKNCAKIGTIAANKKEGFEVVAKGGAIACFGYGDNFLDQNYGYIIKIRNQNEAGQRLFFYILDKTKDQAYLEDRLKNDVEYFILGSKFKHGLGYTLSFQGNSYKNINSSNKVEELTVYLLPYEEVKKLSLFRKELTKASFESSFTAKKINYFLYSVSLNKGEYLVLNQSFDEGWKAYKVQSSKFKVQSWFNTYFPFFFGEELKEHVLVNNWANGWRVNSTIEQSNNETIIIIFWPQYLQFAGFIFLFAGFVYILFYKPHRTLQ